jgi:hypothetical protein
MRYSPSFDQDIIIFTEYSPISFCHLIYRLAKEIFSLIQVISWLPIGFLILFLLLMLIQTTNESFAKQYLRVVLVSVERVDILRCVLTCIPVHHEYLLKLVTLPDDPLLILDYAHVLFLNHLDLLLVDEHLLLLGGRFGLLELLGFFFLIFPLSPGFTFVTLVSAITVVSGVTVVVVSAVPRSASLPLGMIH